MAPKKKKERTCRECGCTELNACLTILGPCWWVEKDLCCACKPNDPKPKRTKDKP
jgi:hypothetical protein